MLEYAPKYSWLKRSDEKGEVRRHALAHTLRARIVVWHDCQLCSPTVNLDRHPDAIFRDVLPEGRRVDKEDLERRPNGWDTQSGRYFKE